MKSWRLTILSFIFLVLAAAIVVRLFYLQVLNGKFYQAQALGQQAGFKEITGARGQVFFQNSKERRGEEGSGELKSLAINKERQLLYAIPKNIKDREAFAEMLGPYVQIGKEDLLDMLALSDTYVIIKKDLPVESVEKIRALKLVGAYWEGSLGRYYPQEALASQVIGFVGGENQSGQYGIEGYYENILKGKTGIREEKNGLAVINATTPQDYLDGSDLYVTIDYNIQFQAESLLNEAKKSIGIDSGQIIVMRPDSGRVLALANFPIFDPNKYSAQTNYAVFQNSAVQKIFEPGSVFKPFIMAMALNEGKVKPESTFTDTGSFSIGPDTIYNFNREKYGAGDMSRILEKSINTGAVYLSRLLAHSTFVNYLEKLGFNEKTGIDLQGEVYSRNDLLKKGSDFGFATASFGQGIEMTPIQLVQAFSIFANGGKMAKPHVVEKIVHGSDQQVIHPEVSREIISPATASQVTKMLINVVDRGFGDAAKIPGYYLAGKTGTAEVPIENKKGYYTDRTVQSFIGYGPALKPEFLILVKLDNPKVPKSSLSAAPIFKKLAQYMINYWQIAPDY